MIARDDPWPEPRAPDRSGQPPIAAFLCWFAAGAGEVVRLEKRARPGAPTSPTETDVVVALSPWQKDVAAVRMLALARRWGIAALGVALLLALAARLDPRLSLWVVAGIPCALFVAGAALLGWHRPSQLEVARLLDRRLGLNEQVATALELLGSPSPRSILAPQVLSRATAALGEARCGWRVGPAPAWREWPALTALLAALLLAVLAPRGTTAAVRHGGKAGGAQRSPVSSPARTRASISMSIQVVSTPAVSIGSRVRVRGARARAGGETRSRPRSSVAGADRNGRGQRMSQGRALSGRVRGAGAGVGAPREAPSVAGRKLPTGTAKSIRLSGPRTPGRSAEIPPSVGGGRPRPATTGGVQRRLASKAAAGLSSTGSSRGRRGQISSGRPGRNPRTRSGVAVGKASLAGSSRSPGGRGAGSARAGTRPAASRPALRPPRRGHLITLRSPGGGRGITREGTSPASPGGKEQRTTASGSQGSAGEADYVAPSANVVPPGDRATISRYFSP